MRLRCASPREKAHVTVADINYENARSVVQEIGEAGGQALPLNVDVTQKDDAERMVRQTAEQFGQLDILVNNAGIGVVAPLMDTDEETWMHS